MRTQADQISIRRYLDPIRRFAPLVLIGTLVGAGLGFAAHTLTGTTYTSYVSVLVSPISGDPVDGLGTNDADVDMATEAEVATSLVVAQRANDLLAGQPPAQDPRDLLRQVDTSVRGTRIIQMSFTAAEPESAQRGAAAFGDAFLAYRNELATSQLEVASGRLAERISELQLELTDVSTRRAEVPESERDGAAYAALVINEQTLLDELSVNQSRLADLRAVITDDAVVLDSASLPRAPSSLGLTALVVGGAAAGFVLGAGLALMLDAARRRNEDDTFAEAAAVRQVLEFAAADVAAPAPTPAAVVTSRSTAVPTGITTVSADAGGATAWGAPAVDAPTEAAPATPLADTPVPDDAVEPVAAAWQTSSDLGKSIDEQVDRWMPPGPEASPVEPAQASSPLEQASAGWSPPQLEGETATEAKPGENAASDDFWTTTLPGSDEDVWAGIVEAAEGVTPAWEPPRTSPWDPPGSAHEVPWGVAASSPWETAPSAADPVSDAVEAPAPVDLDWLLQERARVSVAQLGDHLTAAVDVERRAVVVVDGGDGAAVPVAVAMAVHLAGAGRRTLLVDPRGDALAPAAPGRRNVLDHPTLEVLVGDDATDQLALVARAAGNDTMVVLAGTAIDSPLVTAEGEWAGAIVIATTGVADPASIPPHAFARVMGSRHPLIGIVSIMARPAMAPQSH